MSDIERLREAMNSIRLNCDSPLHGTHRIEGIVEAMVAVQDLLSRHESLLRVAEAARRAKAALRQIPIVKLSKDALSWDCPRCGARAGIDKDGKDITEKCKPDCYVPAVEHATEDLESALSELDALDKKGGA